MSQTPAQTIVQGALDPPLPVQVQRAGVAVDLTGSSNFQFHVKHAGECSGATSVTTADIVDLKGGYAVHGWVAAEVARPGLLLVQLSWTDPAGNPQVWPDDDYVRVRVTPAL